MTTMSFRRETIIDWMTNPAMLARLNELVQFTQRTEVVMELLGIDAKDEDTLRRLIIEVAARQGIPYCPPRGRRSTSFAKLYPRDRYDIVLLMNLLTRYDEAPIGLGHDGHIADTTVDRFITVYRQYLQLKGLPSASDAIVSFERMIQCFEAVRQGTARKLHCTTCGIIYYCFERPWRCPNCVVLNMPSFKPPEANSPDASQQRQANG